MLVEDFVNYGSIKVSAFVSAVFFSMPQNGVGHGLERLNWNRKQYTKHWSVWKVMLFLHVVSSRPHCSSDPIFEDIFQYLRSTDGWYDGSQQFLTLVQLWRVYTDIDATIIPDHYSSREYIQSPDIKFEKFLSSAAQPSWAIDFTIERIFLAEDKFLGFLQLFSLYQL